MEQVRKARLRSAIAVVLIGAATWACTLDRKSAVGFHLPEGDVEKGRAALAALLERMTGLVMALGGTSIRLQTLLVEGDRSSAIVDSGSTPGGSQVEHGLESRPPRDLFQGSKRSPYLASGDDSSVSSVLPVVLVRRTRSPTTARSRRGPARWPCHCSAS